MNVQCDAGYYITGQSQYTTVKKSLAEMAVNGHHLCHLVHVSAMYAPTIMMLTHLGEIVLQIDLL